MSEHVNNTNIPQFSNFSQTLSVQHPIFKIVSQHVPLQSNLVHYVELLDHHLAEYSIMNFLRYFHSVVTTSVFLVKKDIQHLTTIVHTGLRLKRFLSRVARHYIQRVQKPVNSKDLCLESIDTASTYIDIHDPANRRIFYRLTLKECAKFMQNALLLQDNGFYSPCVPKNPYTNRPLTFGQLVQIYIKMKTCQFRIPRPFELFRMSQFNLSYFKQYFHSYLQIRAAKNYVIEQTDAGFNYLLKDMLDDLFLTHEVCLECLVSNPNKRNIFGPLLARFFYDTNVRHQVSKAYYVTTLNELFHQHSFYHFKYNHYVEHDTLFFEELYPSSVIGNIGLD